MRQARQLLLTGLLLTSAASPVPAQTHSAPFSADTLRLSLPEVWQRADAHSRVIAIKKQAVAVGQEEVKDALTERLPEVGVMAAPKKPPTFRFTPTGCSAGPSSTKQ